MDQAENTEEAPPRWKQAQVSRQTNRIGRFSARNAERFSLIRAGTAAFVETSVKTGPEPERTMQRSRKELQAGAQRSAPCAATQWLSLWHFKHST